MCRRLSDTEVGAEPPVAKRIRTSQDGGGILMGGWGETYSAMRAPQWGVECRAVFATCEAPDVFAKSKRTCVVQIEGKLRCEDRRKLAPSN